MFRIGIRELVLGCAIVGAAGCAAQSQNDTAGAPATATASLSPTQGNTATGTITFTRVGDGVRVQGTITGLTPGVHGFHLHDIGDCTAPDGSSAGPHWNPTSMVHGGPESSNHHLGDLGNIEADSTGTAHYDRVIHGIGMTGATSVLGHSIVVHQNADDYTSQPAGNSGPRIACGVIRP